MTLLGSARDQRLPVVFSVMALVALLASGALQEHQLALRPPPFAMRAPVHPFASFDPVRPTAKVAINSVLFSDVITATRGATRCYPRTTQAGLLKT